MRSRLLSSQTNLADAIALVGSLAAITLATLALVGIAPRTLITIAAICTGAALLGRGALITKRVHALGEPVGATFEQAKLGESASDEVLGGAVTIALGVLALIGLSPLLLLAIAAITAGGALALTGPTREKLPHLGALREKHATLAPTRTGHKQHRARRRNRRKSQARAKRRTLSRVRTSKASKEAADHKVEMKATGAKRRRRSQPSASPEPANAKSLPELLSDLAPPQTTNELETMSLTALDEAAAAIVARAAGNDEATDAKLDALVPNAAASTARSDIEQPGEASRAVAAQTEPPEVVDVNDAAKPRNDRQDVEASVATAPELATAHDAEAEATEVADARARMRRAQRASSRGGLLSALRMAASAFERAKHLKHKLDDALAAHPIEQRATAASSASDSTEGEDHALVPYNELAHGTSALEIVDRDAHALELVTDTGDVTTVTSIDTHVDTNEHDVGRDKVVDIDTHAGSHEQEIERDLGSHEQEIERDLRARGTANEVAHRLAEQQHAPVESPSLVTDDAQHESSEASLVTDDAQHEPDHVLTADGSAYRPAADERIDETAAKGLEHQRDALVDAHEIVKMLAAEHIAAENKKLEAEKLREGDPTIDRHATAQDLDAAYRVEAAARAKELEHELEKKLASDKLEEEERAETRRPHDKRTKIAKVELDSLPSFGDRTNVPKVEPDSLPTFMELTKHPKSASRDNRDRSDARDRQQRVDKRAEIELVPTTTEELHRERALFAGAAAWVVGGLAAVVLGICALAGVAGGLVLVEVAFLVAASAILVSAVANGARLVAHVHDETHDDIEQEADAPPLDMTSRPKADHVVLHR